MSLNLHSAYYSREQILSVRRLAALLGVDPGSLQDLARQASTMYRTVPPKDNSKREVFDARPRLKTVQTRVKRVIFNGVSFPPYITGSVKGGDYKVNAARHAGQQIVICEDVKGFFPSVSSEAVRGIWREFFRFSAPVADILTSLTTREGSLPQGAVTSSYLANLVLWRREPVLEAKLRAMGMTYSRYVDDIAMSSNRHLNDREQSWFIAQVYGMLQSEGLRAGRSKHEIYTASEPMFVTKLIANQKPSLPAATRSNVRAALLELEQVAKQGDVGRILAHLGSATQRVGQLGRFHPREASQLKVRLNAVKREALRLAGDLAPGIQPVEE
jgi:hypothetical protein